VLDHFSNQNVMQKKNGPHLALTLTGLLLLILSTFLSCSPTRQNTLDKLQGHWHTDGSYKMSLDITSTDVEMNKYSFTETPDWFPLFDSATHNITLPIPCGNATLPLVAKFSFRDNRLIYNKTIVKRCGFPSMKFVRSDLKACRWYHTFEGHNINVKLSAFPTRTSSVVDLDSLRNTSWVSHVNIGIPKRAEMFGSRPKIQVHDVFIEPHGIKQFVRHEKSNAGSGPLIVCLNVDNAVPDIFLKEVISLIPKDSVAAIYRLVTLQSEERKYSYQKIQP
jgi:hypothetical protein